MITVKVLLGKDTVSIYRKTGDISSVESTAESGGYVITRHFETEAEYKAYAMAGEDLGGPEDWQERRVKGPLPLRRKLRSAKGNLSG